MSMMATRPAGAALCAVVFALCGCTRPGPGALAHLASDAGVELLLDAAVGQQVSDAQPAAAPRIVDASAVPVVSDAGPRRSAPDAAPAPRPVSDQDDAGVDLTQRHDFFSTASIDESDTLTVPSNGDLWVNCWSDDDDLYVANGDGKGFAQALADIVVSRISGHPGDVSDPLAGVTLAVGDQVSSVWTSTDYNRKPTGMLCVDGDLYLAVQDLRTFTYDDAPAATIVKSTDKGKTWTWDHSAPMFAGNVFTTMMFLDFGKDSQHAIDGYAYVYGLDHGWAYNAKLGGPTALYMARAPKRTIQDRATWEFFAGLDDQGGPQWTADLQHRKPVLRDTRRVYTNPVDPSLSPKNMTVLGQGSVVYNAPLHRYLYTSWTEYTHEFYEAPNPWGPWKLFLSKDYGAYPWVDIKNGGYAPTIPSKFISGDGRTMFVQSNSWGSSKVNNYGFSLRKLRVATYAPAVADNGPGGDAVSLRSDAVPIMRALRNGLLGIFNDGVVTGQSDDSWTGDAKPLDYWGYTWAAPVNLNKLVYATGARNNLGGWFKTLDVQVRHGEAWLSVSRLSVSPPYPFDATLPANAVFTLRFDDVTGDGIRIVGAPGGAQYFTTMSELAAYYER
jgi:hypothetical protein